jgi:hypothetical protein
LNQQVIAIKHHLQQRWLQNLPQCSYSPTKLPQKDYQQHCSLGLQLCCAAANVPPADILSAATDRLLLLLLLLLLLTPAR